MTQQQAAENIIAHLFPFVNSFFGIFENFLDFFQKKSKNLLTKDFLYVIMALRTAKVLRAIVFSTYFYSERMVQ